MGTIGVSKYLLIEILVNNVLFGVYAQMAWKCGSIFYQKYQREKVHAYHLASFIFLGLTFTTKVMLDNHSTVKAFTNPAEDGTVSYPSFNSPIVLLLTSLWVVETVVADLFIIYRVWVVWNRNISLTIVPLILLLAGFADGVYLTYLMSTLEGTDPTAFFRNVDFASNAFLAVTLTLNLICTSLIAIKLFSIRRAVHGTKVEKKNDPMGRVVTIIIESAAIYTIMLIFALVTNAAHSFLSYIFLPLLHPTVAMVFSSMIIRSARSGDSTSNSSTCDTTNHNNTRRSTGHRNVYELPTRSFSGGGDGPGGGDEISDSKTAFQSKPLQVKLDTVVTTKVDGEEYDDGYGKKFGGSEV